MKTCHRILAALALLALGLPAGTARADTVSSCSVVASLASVVGQASPAGDPKREVADLLVRARAAMKTGDLATAETLIQQAESKNVSYGPLNFTDDTPKKARGDLEKAKAASGGQGSGLSRLMPGFLGGGQNNVAPSDPFAAGRGPENNQAGSAFSGRAEIPAGFAAPAGGTSSEVRRLPAEATASPEARSQSDRLLVGARKALSLGDARTAKAMIADAKRIGVQYSEREDSPARVDADIARFESLQQARNNSPGYHKQYGLFLLDQAEWMVRWNQLDDAENLARNAENLPVQYMQFENNPRDVLARIAEKRQAMSRTAGSVQQAGGGNNVPPGNVRTAGYQGQGNGYVTPVQGQGALPTPKGAAGQLKDEAERALQAGQMDKARALYSQLDQKFGNEMSPAERDFVRGRLQYLGRSQPGALDLAAQQHEVLRKQVSAALAEATRQARAVVQQNPDRAMQILQQARAAVERANLEPQSKQQLLMRADGDIDSLKSYLAENAPRIKLDQNNRQVRDEIDRERRRKVEVDEGLARMVNEFNTLIDQQRYPEAEVVVKKCAELAPTEPVVMQMRHQVTMVRRLAENGRLLSEKEQAVRDVLENVNKDGTPFDDDRPYRLPENWGELSPRRLKGLKKDSNRSAKEIAIQQKLQTPVSLRFKDTPLIEVMDYLARLAKVNLHTDTQGLAEENVDPRTPVTIELQDDISLKSALNLILQPLGLNYVIKDEVLKITSSQMRDSEVHVETYNVADLVIPIPNFVPNVHMGMQGALDAAYRQTGLAGYGAAPVAAMASANGGSANAKIDPAVLAQMGGAGGMSPYASPSHPMGAGPGGMGGGPEPDFDSLIELITTTIAPSTWQDAGGPGSIAPFETNLTLVVSNTSEVHDQIADLLEQLRRLQDLQVTIEVRFITLNDNFFERIGIDFDFDIDDDIDRPFNVFGKADFNALPTSTSGTDVPAVDHPRSLQDRDHGPSVTVGLERGSTFRADLDIPFRNGSFPLAVPQFGGYQNGAGGELGFAILSDLEAFFFIEASQGDRRSNVLQAPKVTLFNGQSAIVSDTSQSPFVISVIPVVGDFAAALQPVIVVLNEGTFLNVQAVVSNDRRFVRLTMVPFFSTIGDVSTFTFQGSQSTTDDSANDANGDGTFETPARRRTSNEGTTVQLPTFSFVTVVTTVSVPDGGTVLLGGVKRLSEGRNEFGVPILNKLPYVQRLFSNVAIGRETQSLMMMVTPRIIIQEEEEQLLGINTASLGRTVQ